MTISADPNEPLVLADGTKINPMTGAVVKEKKVREFVEIPSASEAQAIVARTRRSIAELPLAANQMNSLAAVLTYTMWGLSNQDIAIALGISLEQVKNIKKLDEYKALSNDIVKAVMEHEANDIRNFFQQNARDAAERIVEFAGEDGALGFSAAKDILDRAGHRPADVHEHRIKREEQLTIVYVDKKHDRDDIPAIDGQFEVINGDRT